MSTLRSYRIAVPLLMISMTLGSCVSASHFRGGSGAPSKLLVGTNGATARNISFQCIGSEVSDPAIIPMADGGIIACQMITANEYSIERLNDTLGTVWKTSFAVPDGVETYGTILGMGGYTPPADVPLRMSIEGENVSMLCYRLREQDTALLVARSFDLRTGAARGETIAHRTKLDKTLEGLSRRFNYSVSPDESYCVAWAVTKTKDNTEEFETVLLRPDFSVVTSRKVKFKPANNDDAFQTMLVNDKGEIFLISFDIKRTITVTREPLLGEGEKVTLKATINDPDRSTKLMRASIGFDGSNTVRIIAGARRGEDLVGIGFAKLDFVGDGHVPISKYIPVPDSVIRQVYGDIDEFENPYFHTGLVKRSSPAYTLIFEQRKLREKAGRPVAGMTHTALADNVLMLGFESNGDLKWRQGFRKDQIDPAGSFAGISFMSHFTSQGTIQFFYRKDDVLTMREYRWADGEALDGGKERVILAFPSTGLSSAAMNLRQTMTWLGDRSFVMSVFERDGLMSGDMKLMKVDY